MACQQLQRCEAVAHEDDAWVVAVGVFCLIHHGIGASLFQRCLGKLVAVEGFALQREENGAGRAVACVGGNDGVLFK